VGFFSLYTYPQAKIDNLIVYFFYFYTQSRRYTTISQYLYIDYQDRRDILYVVLAK